MNTTSDSPELELLRRCFEALSNGDFSVLEEALAEDAVWRTVDEGSTNCQGRETIIEVMSRNLDGRVRGSIEDAIQDGSRVIVAFRPTQPSDAAGRPLEDGIAWAVVTLTDGKITELKGCVDRVAAIGYARTGRPAAPAAPKVQPPETVPELPEQRVDGLIPFVKVANVERSVAFYHHLGFTPTSVYKYRDSLAWAALESGGAEIMFEGSGEPIDPGQQTILFYLYSHELTALRDQLLAAGIAAGEIEDGSPGPRQEMRVLDPDGYVLMIAQID